MSSLQLPPPLIPWAPFLELLPLESALALGPLLRRLDNWIGPLRVAPQSGRIEPDGFDGLARRGSLERLLLSEWLLFEEAPLEFLRRVSQNESSYLQLARRDPHTARASLALFDCGPEVLGGPRLVQLAALVVLARRAQTANATFRWGVWQKPGEWRESVNRESVEWWLAVRSEGEPTEHHREAWEEVWKEEGADFSRDELWMIGSPQLRVFSPPRARLLEVEDELDPFALTRAVETLLDGRTLRLELPDQTMGVRLLRDPFALTAAPKTNDRNSFDIEALDQGLVWAHSGWKLFARTRAGKLLVFSVPNSPSATVGPPKLMNNTQSGDLVAAGRVGRATVAAFLQHYENGRTILEFAAFGRGSTDWNDLSLAFGTALPHEEQRAAKNAPLGQIVGIGSGNALAVLLSTRRFALAHNESEHLDEEEANVLGMGVSNGIVSVLKPDGQSARFTIPSEGAKSNDQNDGLPPVVTQAHVGWGGHAGSSLWALGGLSEWQLRTPGQRTTISFNSPHSVVGCVLDGGEAGLIAHGAGERELWFHGQAEERKLFRFSSPIQSVAVCPFAPLVAVQGEDELGVWSLAHGAWLLRARTG